MNICIIGGGATGLVAGYELIKKGHSVTICEGAEGPGGLVGVMNVGQLPIEGFYHHIFTSDTHIIQLIDELGLSPKLLWREPKNGMYANNRLYPFTSPLDLLRFEELSFIERIRMGMLVYIAKFIKEWTSLESMSSKDWIIKYAGNNVYEKVWGTLLQSKFDVDADKVSAVWIWNKFKLRGSSRGKNINKEQLGYLEGSFGLVYKALAERIAAMGGQVLYNTLIRQVLQKPDKSLDVMISGKARTFDKVLVTSAPVTLKHLGLPLDSGYMDRLEKIKYKSNICMMLELKESISPYYWVTVAQKDWPFVLVIEHTRLIPDERYGSKVVYLSRYLDEKNPLYTAGDHEIRELFLDHLKKLFPGFDSGNVLRCTINRARYAQPVVVENYSSILPDYKTPIENLYLASMAQIYPEDRGQNYSIRMGVHIANVIAGDQ